MTTSSATTTGKLLQAWQSATVRPVSPAPNQHTIHSYFNTCPESPDGCWVLFFRSTTPEAHSGEVVIRHRESGEERVLAHSVTTEDAHRVACQQWVARGREVVFHDLRDDEWVVVSVDVQTLRQRVLARGWQIGWGQPDGGQVPLYAPHYRPRGHFDLNILQVETGEAHTALTAGEVKRAYPTEVAEVFGDRPVSIFFPILSPDLQRVIFKLATPNDGVLRSKQASLRDFLIGYDFASRRFLFRHKDWGHPAWAPDSRSLINAYNILIEAETGAIRDIPGLPRFPGTHPSISPDGKLFITDTFTRSFGGPPGEWGLVVGDINGGAYHIIHRFDHLQGASSPRIPHPHPAMTRDGKRIYFNVSTQGWTRLLVAERQA